MITANGFQTKTLLEILEEIREAMRAEFGDAIDLSPGNPLGQIIGIYAERELALWNLAQDIYNNQYPNSSNGRNLDNAVSLTGTRRRPATRSRVISGVATGINGTTVPKGTVIAVAGNENARFATDADSEIKNLDNGVYKSDPILLIAQNPGSIEVPVGTLTDIISPVSGLNSFTNLEMGITGSDLENDSDLKGRRQRELGLAGVGTVEAIKSSLSSRPLVTAVEIFQNFTSITVNNIPPHSIEILVKGDSDDSLAMSIFNLVGGGITLIGNVTKVITDSQDHQQTIRFSRPVEIPIFINFNLKTTTDFPADGSDRIKAAVIEWGKNARIGQDVILLGSNSLLCLIDNIPGITGGAVTIGRVADALFPNNLIIAVNELPTYDMANITVTTT